MIQIHTSGNIDITKNGIIINPISCEIKPVLNGENELVMEFAIDEDGLYKYIQNNNLISVPTPDFEEDQLYRIYDTKKSMSGNKITAYARHVQFDLSKKVTFNKTLNNATGQQALNTILENTGFTGYSNITMQNTIQYKLRNTMNAINGTEVDAFINCYGGEISCNNYTLTVNTKRGSDKGMRVTFGYNLEDVEENLNFDDVITRLYPYSGDLVLSGNGYTDSPLISSIGVFEDSIEFSDIKVKENVDDTEGFNTLAEAQSEMIRRCNERFKKGLDKITANYIVRMQDLSKTTEYKRLGYDVLEKICLGDTVHCYNKNIDIEVEVRCISYKWDCVNEEYIEIELGQFISSYVEMQNKKIDDTNKKVDDTKAELKDDIADANEKTDNLKVVMEKRDNEIELSVTNEAEARATAIEVMDGKIEERVTEDEFGTYKTQTAKEISQKVSAGDAFSSELKQNVSAFQFLFKGASNGKTEITARGITVYEGGFEIRDNNNERILWMESNGVLRAKFLWADDLKLDEASSKTASSLWNVLYNMETISVKELKPSKLTIDHDEFYIDGGYDLKDYVETICYKMLQDQGLI